MNCFRRIWASLTCTIERSKMSEFSYFHEIQCNFHFFYEKMLLFILNTENIFKSTATYSHFLIIKIYSIGYNYSLVTSKTTCNLAFENGS